MLFIKFARQSRAIISNQTYNLSNITSLVVHENVEKIESTALNKCVNLQTVIIYSHDILIESYTFANCVNLEALYFHGNISEYQKLNEYMGLSNKVKIYILDDNDNYILYEK